MTSPEMTSDNTMDATVRKPRINMYDLFSYLIEQDSLVIKQITSNGLPVNFPDPRYKWNQPSILTTEISLRL